MPQPPTAEPQVPFIEELTADGLERCTGNDSPRGSSPQFKDERVRH